MRYKDGKSEGIETMKKHIRLILPIITKVDEFVDGVSEFENDKLSHSKKMFPTPATDKPVIGFDLPLFEPPAQKLKAVNG